MGGEGVMKNRTSIRAKKEEKKKKKEHIAADIKQKQKAINRKKMTLK